MVAREDYIYIDKLMHRILSLNPSLKQTTSLDDPTLVQVVGKNAKSFFLSFEAMPPFNNHHTRVKCVLTSERPKKQVTLFLRENTWTQENSSQEITTEFISTFFDFSEDGEAA